MNLHDLIVKISEIINIYEKQHPKFHPILYQILASLALSITTLIIKLLTRISASQMIIFRSVFTQIINGIVIIGFNVQAYPQNQPSIYKKIIIRGIIGGIGIQLFFEGSKLLPLSESIVLQKTSPVWTALLAIFYLKTQKYSTKIFLNTLFCMIGIVFIAQPPFLNILFYQIGLAEIQINKPQQDYYQHVYGVLLNLTAAFLISLIQILISSLSGQISQFTIIQYATFCQLVISALFLFYTPIKPINFMDFRMNEYFGLFFLGLTGCLAQWLNNRSFLQGNLTQISLVGQSQILFSFIFEYLFLNHSYDIISLIGILMVLFGLVLEINRKDISHNPIVIKI